MNILNIVTKGLELTSKNDGATLLKNGDEASHGYACGGTLEFKIPYTTTDQEALSDLVFEACSCILLSSKFDAFGFWLDGDMLYIDAVTIFQDATEALAFAAENDELAIFCIHTQDEIRL